MNPNALFNVQHIKARLAREIASAPKPIYCYYALEDALKELTQEMLTDGFEQTLARYSETKED